MPGATITGGGFQDCEGNLVSGGVLTLELNTVCTDLATGTFQICPGDVVAYSLDANGNILGTQYVWSNDLLSPKGTFYRMIVYTSKGQLAWGPNFLRLISVSGVVNLNLLVPDNPA
jgi:hypothetical protein